MESTAAQIILWQQQCNIQWILEQGKEIINLTIFADWEGSSRSEPLGMYGRTIWEWENVGNEAGAGCLCDFGGSTCSGLRKPTDGGGAGRTGRLEWSSSHCHSTSLTLLNPLYSPPCEPPPGQGSLNKYLSLKQSGQSKLSTFQLSNNSALPELYRLRIERD